MKCPRCENRLRIVRTVDASPAGKTQDAVCPSCEGRFTVVSLILLRQKYGEGARGRASDLGRKGARIEWGKDGRKLTF